jgi:uncharacterized protein (TIGR02246 family)
MLRVMTATFVVIASYASAFGAEPDVPATSEAQIQAAVRSYVEAYNQGDAKAVASKWAPEAVYTDARSGEQVVGRDAIEQQFAEIFKEYEGTKLEAISHSIRFVSPSVAIEQGTARLIRPDDKPEESNYSAVYIKIEGTWLLDRITEEDVLEEISNYEQLKDLEWMICTWVDQDEQSRIETTCQWAKNKNFMIRSFAMSVGDRIEMSGMQIVGWDPAQKRIRSWVFDSDGGFNEGVWTKKDNRWFIQATGTLPDGGSTSAVNIITKRDDDTYTWQTIDRQAGGELLPNIDEVVVVRAAPADSLAQ